MDRHDPRDRPAADAALDDEPPRRPSPHPPWVKIIAAAIVVLVVLATVAGALF